MLQYYYEYRNEGDEDIRVVERWRRIAQVSAGLRGDGSVLVAWNGRNMTYDVGEGGAPSKPCLL